MLKITNMTTMSNHKEISNTDPHCNSEQHEQKYISIVYSH
jgi:hypothetical protein